MLLYTMNKAQSGFKAVSNWPFHKDTTIMKPTIVLFANPVAFAKNFLYRFEHFLQLFYFSGKY